MVQVHLVLQADNYMGDMDVGFNLTETTIIDDMREVVNQPAKVNKESNFGYRFIAAKICVLLQTGL